MKQSEGKGVWLNGIISVLGAVLMLICRNDLINESAKAKCVQRTTLSDTIQLSMSPRINAFFLCIVFL